MPNIMEALGLMRQPKTLQQSSVDRQGFPVDLGRPFVQLEEGGMGTEYQATEQMPDGSWVNFPTIWDGKQLPISDAIERFMAAQQQGQQFPTFQSKDEAIAAAQDRSARIGELRGMSGNQPDLSNLLKALGVGQ